MLTGADGDGGIGVAARPRRPIDPASPPSQQRGRWLGWPIRHPRAAIGITIALALLSVLGVLRIRPDTSLAGLFPRGNPAAAALVNVLDDFSVAEELMLLVSLPEETGAGASPTTAAGAAPPPQSEKLLAFARRLEAAVAADEAAKGMVESINYRIDGQTRPYFEGGVVPAGLYYHDDATLAAARRRLPPEAKAAQVRQTAPTLRVPGPAAGALAKSLLPDPLRQHQVERDRLAAQRAAFKIRAGGDAFVSPDGRSLLIRIPGRRPVNDLDFTKAFVGRMRHLAAGANADGLALEFSGAYAIATESERSIRSDAIASTFQSLFFLTVLFCIAYRGPVKLFLLAFGPVALGNLLGFGGYSLWSTALTPMTAVIGAMLAEMGINYSIHYLSLYDTNRAAARAPADAAGRTSREIALPLLAAWMTSIVGFLAVGFSSLQVLREFAILGTVALAGAVLCTLLLLQPVLVLIDRRDPAARAAGRTRLRFGFAPVLARLVRHGRPLAFGFWGAFAVAAAVLAWPGQRLAMETDLTIMHPRPNPPLDAQRTIAQKFGWTSSPLIVSLRAGNAGDLVALAHEVDRRLRSGAARAAGVSATTGLASLLPDPAVAPSRASAFSAAEVDRIVADFRAVVADSAFEPSAYDPYVAFLRTLLSPGRPPTVADLVAFDRLAGTVLPRSGLGAGAAGAGGPRESIVMVSLDRSLGERGQRAATVSAIRASLAGLPGATLTGMDVISHETESAVARDLPRMLIVGVGAVLLYLLVHFRGVRDAALVVLPTAFSLVVLLAVMRVTGQKLNMVNLVSAPLLIGINIDYGIFLVSLARTARARDATAAELVTEIGTSCHAVLVCAITTLLGFGSLVFTSVPAIRSLGFAVAVGVSSCLLATLLYLAPLLVRRAARAGGA